ncbi:MAG: glycosyltransferase [Luteolibacter sp.]|uniref:glycosyltransferase family 32 protein n=1 Tax=Luteolibacter sp. TaxID=1962973 RepID=UPI00326716D9
MEIPRIIHQSWKNEDIPFEIYPAEWQSSWKTNHPEWSYRLWTDHDNRELVRTEYPDFLDFYDSLDVGIKKADFCRFLYMHRFGGIYVDLDFISLREMTPLLYGASIVVGQLSEDNCYYRIPNAFMASEPGVDFWITVATDAMNAPPEEHGVERHAGPFRLQWALHKHRPQGLRTLDQHLVYPLDWINFTKWQDGVHYNQVNVDLAWNMRQMDLPSIQARFPQSFAVTTWNHNW